MSSDAMAIRAAEASGKPWVETIHEWVTTVDHKRLGILYIVFALTFLVIGGGAALRSNCDKGATVSMKLTHGFRTRQRIFI